VFPDRATVANTSVNKRVMDILFSIISSFQYVDFKVYKENPPHIITVPTIYHHLLSTYMAFQYLIKTPV
jgi:hypothetical protein